ncbi:MAG: prevent-host-death protein, partial [Ignavibacteriae bacterium HGW-Ignavibacteriae-4]
MKKIIFLLLIASSVYSQQTQNVTGIVIDADTEMPLPSATVQIINSELKLGAITNGKGEFTIKNVPIGRISFQASYIGYANTIINSEQITTAKIPYLVFKLTESSASSGELIVTPKLEKDISINPMTVVSSHLLSVEEASRYAGGFDDPARLASAFAGVASSVSNNAIVIRGNAPKFLQWN